MALKPESYKNVMEIFVEEEIKEQLKNNTTIKKSLTGVNLLQVETFALNRLPCLYATSAEGVERQKRKFKTDSRLKKEVALAVSRGFAAVERDPLKEGTPLPSPTKEDILQQAKTTLNELNTGLPEKELSWLIAFMEQFLKRVNSKQITEGEIVKLFFLLNYYWGEND